MRLEDMAVKRFMEASMELATEIAKRGVSASTKEEAEFVVAFTMVNMLNMLHEDIEEREEK